MLEITKNTKIKTDTSMKKSIKLLLFEIEKSKIKKATLVIM